MHATFYALFCNNLANGSVQESKWFVYPAGLHILPDLCQFNALKLYLPAGRGGGQGIGFNPWIKYAKPITGVFCVLNSDLLTFANKSCTCLVCSSKFDLNSICNFS